MFEIFELQICKCDCGVYLFVGCAFKPNMHRYMCAKTSSKSVSVQSVSQGPPIKTFIGYFLLEASQASF